MMRGPISRFLYVTDQTSEFDVRLWSGRGASKASESDMYRPEIKL